MEKVLEKGEKILLDIQDSARRRVICGLRWDPMDDKTQQTLDRNALGTGGSSMHHDLDLLCLMFDEYGRFMDGVTGEEGHRTGDSGNIYHTGDVVDGEDDLDDEQISLELFNLSSDIHQIFFVAEVQSAHNFGDIDSPEIRIANAIDDRNFAHSAIGFNEGADKDAYVFGSIIKTPRGWVFHYLNEYVEGESVSDWAEMLKPHIVIATDPDGKPKVGPPVPNKGESVPLHYKKEARHRILCGLNWDPLEADIGRLQKLQNLGYNIESFDLDLACVIYNQDGEAVDGVSAKADENLDESGKIYHSGDDTSGEGDRVDDESISVELRELPDYIHHIVFVAEIQSLHDFDHIVNPTCRIGDGMTNVTQLKTRLDNESGQGMNAYVFARITRKDDAWLLTNIDEFFRGDEIEDWIEYLKRYLA